MYSNRPHEKGAGGGGGGCGRWRRRGGGVFQRRVCRHCRATPVGWKDFHSPCPWQPQRALRLPPCLPAWWAEGRPARRVSLAAAAAAADSPALSSGLTVLTCLCVSCLKTLDSDGDCVSFACWQSVWRCPCRKCSKTSRCKEHWYVKGAVRSGALFPTQKPIPFNFTPTKVLLCVSEFHLDSVSTINFLQVGPGIQEVNVASSLFSRYLHEWPQPINCVIGCGPSPTSRNKSNWLN